MLASVLLLVLLAVTLFISIYKFVRDLKENKERKKSKEHLYNILAEVDYALYDTDSDTSEEKGVLLNEEISTNN